VTSRPLIVVAQLVLAIAVVLILASLVADTPRSGLVTLALILSLSGAGSLLVGAALVRWTRGRVGTVRLRMVLAIGVGLLIGLANVFVASTLMLLTSEDLPLFALVLAFAGAISLAFGHSVAVALMSELTLSTYCLGEPAPYCEAFQFEVSRGGSGDPDQPVAPGPKARQVTAKVVEFLSTSGTS
jgi:hypothetical protein